MKNFTFLASIFFIASNLSSMESTFDSEMNYAEQLVKESNSDALDCLLKIYFDNKKHNNPKRISKIVELLFKVGPSANDFLKKEKDILDSIRGLAKTGDKNVLLFIKNNFPDEESKKIMKTS